MNSHITSKSSLFLMELILAIFFFSLASAVCIQLFVKAHLLGNHTLDLNHSVLEAQNIAEAYLGNNGDFFETADILHGSLQQDDAFFLYFDSDWNEVPESYAVYTAAVQDISNTNLHQADIEITDKNHNELYHLTVSRHVPLEK